MKSIVLFLNHCTIEISIASDGVGTIKSNLGDGSGSYHNDELNGMESLLLAMACEGIDLDTDQMKRAIETTIDAIGNNTI